MTRKNRISKGSVTDSVSESDIEQEPKGTLVIFNYKGHRDSIVIQLSEDSYSTVLKKKHIKGVVEEVYPPGNWHYDKVTLVPVPD